MKLLKIKDKPIIRVKSSTVIIKDLSTALDFVMTVAFETKVNQIIIDKSIIDERFFDLKTRILGETIQKFVTYNIKVAIVGDYSIYSSKSLSDYIKESNRGKDIFFVSSEDEAVKQLSK